MSIFKNLFGSKGKPSPESQISKSEISNSHPSDELLKNIFVDSEPPYSEYVEERKQSRIVSFIERDWSRLGLNDGYEYGTQEVYDLQVKHIKSEFRKIIDQMVDEKRVSITELKHRKIEIGSLSNSTVLQLEVVINETQKSIDELLLEKNLSVENEGLVMDVVHPYSIGFKKGLHSKEEERMIFNPISNFFNSKK